VFGHKPTWGICPLLGHALSDRAPYSDVSVIGPMARSASDLTIALDAMSGAAPTDIGWRLDLPPPRVTSFSDLRVALMTIYPLSEVDASITGKLIELTHFLRREGATVSDTARPDFDLARGHRLFIEMLFATTSANNDDAASQHWRDEASRLADDTCFYAMMVRDHTMNHRDWLIGKAQQQCMRRAWAAFFQEWDVLLCPRDGQPGTAARSHRTINSEYYGEWPRGALHRPIVLGRHGQPMPAARAGRTAWYLYHWPAGRGADYRTAPADRTTIEVARMLEHAWQRFVRPPGWD
jgi:amidase